MSTAKVFLYGATTRRMRDAVAHRALVHTLGELCETGETPARPDEWIDAAAGWGWVESSGARLLPGRNAVFVPAAVEAELQQRLAPSMEAYVDVVAEAAPRLREVYEASPAAQRHPWAEVVHSVVAGMLMDMAVGQLMTLPGEVAARHGGASLWVFGSMSARNGFGVKWARDAASRAAVGQLWHVRARRPAIPLQPEAVAVLARFLRGDEACSRSREWLQLRYSRLVVARAGGFELAIPHLAGPEGERLMVLVLDAGRRLVREGIGLALHASQGSEWWRRRSREQPSLGHALLRLVLEYGTDRAIARGALPPFPEGSEVPFAWGRWLLFEPEDWRRVMP